jgi:hypothetical protein
MAVELQIRLAVFKVRAYGARRAIGSASAPIER